VPVPDLRPLSTELFGHFARAETFVLFPGAVELLFQSVE